MEQQTAHAGDEIGAGDPELLLREVPRKGGERRRRPRWIDGLRDAELVPSPCAALDEVAGMSSAPVRLGAAAAGLLAAVVAADALAIANARIRGEGAAAYAAAPTRR